MRVHYDTPLYNYLVFDVAHTFFHKMDLEKALQWHFLLHKDYCVHVNSGKKRFKACVEGYDNPIDLSIEEIPKGIRRNRSLFPVTVKKFDSLDKKKAAKSIAEAMDLSSWQKDEVTDEMHLFYMRRMIYKYTFCFFQVFVQSTSETFYYVCCNDWGLYCRHVQLADERHLMYLPLHQEKNLVMKISVADHTEQQSLSCTFNDFREQEFKRSVRSRFCNTFLEEFFVREIEADVNRYMDRLSALQKPS